MIVSLDRPVTHSEIVAQAKQASLKQSSVSKLLQRLQAKGCAQQAETGSQKGRYFVDDPLFAEYVRRKVSVK